MNLRSTRLCFVGNMLGRNPNHITTQGQIVADLFAEEGYEVTSVSSRINRVTRLAEIIQTLLKDNRKFDLILLEVYSGMNFIVANIVAAICRLFKLPLVMVLHGGNLPEFTKKYSRWAKFALNRADALIAPSPFLAGQIGNLGYKIEVIPNVVDLDRYPFRERSAISPKLIWMRSFHPIYNPEMAVNVLAKLRQTEPDATLTMAGADKGLEESIKLLVNELGMSDAVRFAGFLDQEKKVKEFSEANIYINTNRIDNMPVSVVEARAAGLPVVATNVGGLPYLIEHGENGLLVEDGDVDAMVENIKKLLNDPELTQKISRAGRKLAERSTWESVRREWEKLFSELLRSEPIFLAGEITNNKC